MNTTDAIIIGEGFLGLYSGIKLAEKGYNVKIFEKNSSKCLMSVCETDHNAFRSITIEKDRLK